MNNINHISQLTLFLLAIFFFSMRESVAQEDAINSYFHEYMTQEGFNSIYISPRMFNLFAKRDPDNKAEIDEAISRLNGLRILTIDSTLAHKGMELYQEAMDLLRPYPYEELMSVRNGDEQLRFYALDAEDPDRVKELLMLIGGQKNFFLLSITGNISLKQISSLSESMDIDGMENLERLNDH